MNNQTEKPINENVLADAKDVQNMFDDIAPDYDRLNHIMTFGIDRIWRRKLVRIIAPLTHKKILDIATGTGDLAFDILKNNPAKIHGIDFSEKMIRICKQKVKKNKLEHSFFCEHADVMKMPFENDSFDIVTIAFGFRNFKNKDKALKEIERVIKPGGSFVVLEFFNSGFVRKNKLFRFYMRKVLPGIGRLISGHPWAYRYLFDSIEKFESEEEFVQLLKNYGFTEFSVKKLMFGMAHIIKCERR